MEQGWLSNWLVKHEVVHRSLGFDHRGIETLQIKAGDWDSIAAILYVYDNPEEVCIKVFAQKNNPRIRMSSGFGEVPIFKNVSLMIWWESLMIIIRALNVS
uniref:Uncharacterized protein n=1 Tax=Avena sativa TaxID=4498 RepID=A0ACD5YG61_AVESA